MCVSVFTCQNPSLTNFFEKKPSVFILTWRVFDSKSQLDSKSNKPTRENPNLILPFCSTENSFSHHKTSAFHVSLGASGDALWSDLPIGRLRLYILAICCLAHGTWMCCKGLMIGLSLLGFLACLTMSIWGIQGIKHDKTDKWWLFDVDWWLIWGWHISQYQSGIIPKSAGNPVTSRVSSPLVEERGLSRHTH